MHATQNEGYGYHGGLASTAWIRQQVEEAYSNTVAQLVRKGIAASPEEAVNFLDSRMGRHLGDAISKAETINQIAEIIGKQAPEHMEYFRKENGPTKARRLQEKGEQP